MIYNSPSGAAPVVALSSTACCINASRYHASMFHNNKRAGSISITLVNKITMTVATKHDNIMCFHTTIITTIHIHESHCVHHDIE